MSKINPKKKKGLRDLLCAISRHKLGVEPKEYNILTNIILVTILILSLCLLARLEVASILNFKTENNQTDNRGFSQQVNQENNSKIDFSNGNWVIGQGNLSKLIGSSSIFYLPHGENSGLLKYTTPLNDKNSLFQITFKSHSKGDSMNFIVTFPNVYELVIGDDDLRTITLKKSPSLGEPPKENIKEQRKNTVRPALKNDIIIGSEVALNIEQKLLLNGNMLIQVDIRYWHNLSEKKEPDVFLFEFRPPPGIEDLMHLHVGILRDKTTDVSNSFELLDPILDIVF